MLLENISWKAGFRKHLIGIRIRAGKNPGFIKKKHVGFIGLFLGFIKFLIHCVVS